MKLDRAATHEPVQAGDPWDGPDQAVEQAHRERRAQLVQQAGRKRGTQQQLSQIQTVPDGALDALVLGGLLDEHIAYVTSDESFRTPFAHGYRVVERLPYREKQLKAALHQRGIGRLTIKKRGVDIVPDALRKRLDLRGENEATLVMTRLAGVGTALLVQPF